MKDKLIDETEEYTSKGIGRVVISFQNLEVAIEHLIFSCMTSPYQQIKIIMSKISFKNKVDIMSALIKDLYSSDQELDNKKNIHSALAALVKRCRESEARRNQLMHSNWHVQPDFSIRMKDKVNAKGHKQVHEYVHADEFKKDIDFINSLCNDVYEFNDSLSISFNLPHGQIMMSPYAVHYDDMIQTIRDNMKGANP